MLRRNIRLRKEYLYKKALEEQDNIIRDRKRRIKEAIAQGKPLAPSDRHFEAQLRGRLDLEDERSLSHVNKQDDEYAYAGIKNPRILLTTSRAPSSRLLQFVKELKLVFPDGERVNRGSYVMSDLVKLCQTNEISDLVVVHEHRGIPDGLVVSHMPLGPTVYFSLEDVVLRHDLPNKAPPMSLVAPHLIFHNFTSRLGERVSTVLKHLFPPAAPLGKRVLSFVNRNDKIHFRHFVWTDERHDTVKEAAYRNLPDSAVGKEESEKNVIKSAGEKNGNKGAVVAREYLKSLEKIHLTEVGPRFVLKPYRIELGTADMKDLELEWALKPFINKPRQILGS